MSSDSTWFRSQKLFDRNQSALLVVDVQESLTPKVLESRRMLWNIERLLRGATELGLPIEATEQYPQGLKETVAQLHPWLGKRHEKIAFSIASVRELVASLVERGVTQLVVCGIETHICIMQSALDLIAEGFEVQVVVDAVSARQVEDHSIALERIRDSGGTLTTTETILFEWCRTAKDAGFKTIRNLVQESPPGFPRNVGFVRS
jgi:nicotinamidase-related amidase